MNTRLRCRALPSGDLYAVALAAALWLVLTAPAGAAPAPANLADLSLEQLMEIPVDTVVSASKYEQKITRAPASVSIVSAGEIAAFGHRTLADVLRSVRGFYVADDRNYSYLGARGFLRPGDYNTRVLVLVDGHRMNDNIYDSTYFGRDNTVDPDGIDRVEIIRGPSSSIYGSSAFFGVINVVTKRGAQLEGTEVSGETGSFGTHRGRVTYGHRLAGGTEVALSAAYFHSNGQRDIYFPEFDQRISSAPQAANNGIAQHADAENAFRFSASVTFQDFTLSAALCSRTKTVPTASYETLFNSPLERTTDNRGYVDLAYRHEFSPRLRLLARASYDVYTYYGAYPYDFAEAGQPLDLVMSRDRTVGEWIGTEWQLTATLADRHTVVAGAEFREDLRQDQASYYDTVPHSEVFDDHRRGRKLGLYAQGEFALGADVLLNAGVRYDHYYDGFGGTLNPRVGLIYNPHERTTLKLLYGQAFRAPNVYERSYYPDPSGTELVPERIRTFEIAAEHYFTQRHRLGVSLYRYHTSDLITQTATPDGVIYFANLDRAEATGLEVELEGRYAAGLRLRASHAWQHTKDENTGAELTSSPRHLSKLGVIWPFSGDRFTAGLELQHQGAVRTLSGASTRNFVLGNLTLTAHRLPHGVELAASVYNLFDQRYDYPGAEDHLQDVIPQPGRTFNLRATFKF